MPWASSTSTHRTVVVATALFAATAATTATLPAAHARPSAAHAAKALKQDVDGALGQEGVQLHLRRDTPTGSFSFGGGALGTVTSGARLGSAS
ncbi:hypothetical protein [Streptomyces sp. HUAS TT20]|uniref:hypothetical protein n=1 Tax=Streptomyces sp. HUAS TT20 TaxID=3447509 RepID=UPI0021D9DEA2|nr:hypothetical protein [Streptomyces sp. HUAS 15-9]UXY27530.1 hypothetical protein N8I87_13695 [Streptomyces sp. HUAS 15-9]